ncbi:hypothetical protein Ahy_A07g033308 [Arachis hypogaea]|uniref:DNA helicase Pif1-like 2B domain-containing protein n=1 Tax=Arachis hypogaea TaxID=3818 RepID=A0A445C901_ARAHY|nr:hypothetical protein Ahy_A07g033308 [Arachis hypogaea]
MSDMLLRNIDQSSGLCNGTRLKIRRLGTHVIECMTLTEDKIEKVVLIPHMNMIPTHQTLPFRFQHRQFPIIIFFAMTINKSQEQTLSAVGLYLPRPVFTHGCSGVYLKSDGWAQMRVPNAEGWWSPTYPRLGAAVRVIRSNLSLFKPTVSTHFRRRRPPTTVASFIALRGLCHASCRSPSFVDAIAYRPDASAPPRPPSVVMQPPPVPIHDARSTIPIHSDSHSRCAASVASSSQRATTSLPSYTQHRPRCRRRSPYGSSSSHLLFGFQ